MVMITPEEVMARKKRVDVDPLSPHQRENLGNSARITIPLPDVFLLRKVAPMLAGLAEHIAFTARRTDLREYDLLMSIRNEIESVNIAIRDMHGGANKNGTYPKYREDTEQ